MKVSSGNYPNGEVGRSASSKLSRVSWKGSILAWKRYFRDLDREMSAYFCEETFIYDVSEGKASRSYRPGGGMVDTQHLKCCEATRAGSSPALGTLKGHTLHTTCS